jgi:transcriptional regulator with XRE-family HTH domain
MGRARQLRRGAVEFGARVRHHRSRHGWSQMELATRAGFHFTYVSDIENGKRNVTLETILRLAAALEVNPGGLIDGLTADPGQP